MKYRNLGKTGLSVSSLSFGASSLGAVFHDIDVAPAYGATRAETVLGRALLPLAVQKEVGIINASPFAGGLLTGREAPAWHPASPTERAVGLRWRPRTNA